VGQAFRGLAKTGQGGTIKVVSKSHLFAWPSVTGRVLIARLASLGSRFGESDGQGLVEYTLTVSLIAIVCIAALTATGTSLSGIVNSIAGQV
jgi:Flp pilus assembly pilin Flp